MAKEEAEKLVTFQNYCTCGGHAWSMNGRPQSQPHMDWCPQFTEYAERWKAMHPEARTGDRVRVVPPGSIKGIKFRCLLCGKEFETVEECNACEESHQDN